MTTEESNEQTKQTAFSHEYSETTYFHTSVLKSVLSIHCIYVDNTRKNKICGKQENRIAWQKISNRSQLWQGHSRFSCCSFRFGTKHGE